MKIKAPYLLLIAGLFFLIPGVLITRIGIMTRFDSWGFDDPWRIVGAVLVFLVFALFIFAKIVKKHVARIKGYGDTKQSVFNAFGLKTWLIIIFMIVLGVVLRRGFGSHQPVENFIAFFYPGLGLALFVTGIRFVIALFRK